MSSQDGAENNKIELAKKRWKLLIDVLVKGKNKVDTSISVRRFASFGLLKTNIVGPDADIVVCDEVSADHLPNSADNIVHESPVKKKRVTTGHLWYEYTCLSQPQYQCFIRHLDDSINIQDVLGFNNTGNVCVWPSEEVLTYYCIQNSDHFRHKSVCELGGGMTCLAGVAVWLCTDAKEVLMTDGNETSVGNVQLIINRNKLDTNKTTALAQVLRWNDHDKLGDVEGRYDIVICADCLFFDEYRADLVKVLWQLLKPQGEVIVFAPARGQTFQQFKDLAGEKFRITEKNEYDSKVWELHQSNIRKGIEAYDPNLHYPKMLHLVKEEQSSD